MKPFVTLTALAGLAMACAHTSATTTTTMTNTELVTTAVTTLFSTRSPDALERFWSPAYRQHSAFAKDGLAGARELTKNLPPGFRYDLVRAFGEGDLVVTHGVYTGLAPVPLVAFDLWRVENGRIVEHWDAATPQVAHTASGRSQVDGPTRVEDLTSTAANRAVVERFVDQVAIGGDFAAFPTFFHGDAYAQHNPQLRDGVSLLLQDFGRLAKENAAFVITKRHRTVASGHFVFVQSEGRIGDKPAALYDLWRVDGGRLAEHWDVAVEQPASLPHANGLF